MKSFESLISSNVSGLSLFNYGDTLYNESDEAYYLGDFNGVPILVKCLFGNYVRASIPYKYYQVLDSLIGAITPILGNPSVSYRLSYPGSSYSFLVIDWYSDTLKKVCTDLLSKSDIPFICGDVVPSDIKYYDSRSLKYVPNYLP